MKQKIIMTQGLPGSGKSFWAKQHCIDDPLFKRVNKDDIRAKYGNQRWSSQLEKSYLKEERETGIEYLKAGFNLIVDDTNFNDIHKNFWQDVANENNYDFEIKFFDTDLKVCIERNVLRDEPVPEVAIRSMYNKYIKNKPKYDDRLITYNSKSTKQKCIIFDIDGTLALMNGRNAFDYHKVDTDRINTPVMFLNNLLWASRFGEWTNEDNRIKIILLSGREETAREKTVVWLKENNVIYDELLMRKEKDFRGDEVIKKEIYESKIAPYYEVVSVFDDRDKVVQMWRSLGLLCCQVYYGDF